MGKHEHKEAYEGLIEAQQQTEQPYNLENDVAFAKYSNRSPSRSTAKTTKTTAGLNPYGGAWTKTEVIHLLRRTTFGPKWPDVQTLLAMTPGQAVDYLISNSPSAAPAPPINNYEASNYTDPTSVPADQTWVNALSTDGTLNSKRRSSLQSWWMGLIINQNLSILEKMTLFWHRHFATELDTIGNAVSGYRHHAMLRQYALGNFKTLVKQVTVDVGMLRYLNGYLNTKTAPDENYGRELQELFTVGKDSQPMYSEADVQAAAKVLTGWRIDNTTLTSFFDATKHDTTNKQFSSYYNNTVINYQSGANGALETDALITMLFAKPDTAKHLCRNLYRFFMYYDIDATVEANVIAPLAQTLINNNFEIVPVLKQLFKSEHFFETNSKGCYIRTPIDYLAGTFRSFGVMVPNTMTPTNQYKIWNYVRTYGTNLGMTIGDPPNVSSWPAFYQNPEFHELWINSNTLPKRMVFTDMMLNSGFSASSGSTIKVNVITFAQQCANVNDPVVLVDWSVDLLLGLTLSATKKASLVSILLSGQTSNYYWTQAWDAYIANPNTSNTNIVKTRLTSLYLELTRMAEAQLC